MNPLDLNLQRMIPVIPVPRYEPLVPLTVPGHRYLLAADGLYLEICRAWLYGVFPRGERIPLPYGPVAPTTQFGVTTPVMRQMLEAFVAKASQAGSIETASWYSLDTSNSQIVYWPAPPMSCSSEHIQYERPPASRTVVPMMDCHSHGLEKAYWSPIDNEDDVDDVKIAVVVGNVDQAQVSLKMRLVGSPMVDSAHGPVDISDWGRAILYATEKTSP